MNIIACVNEKDWGIGKDNKLLHYYQEDMGLFRNLTFGGVVIMGKHTFLSLPNGPLDNRFNIVLTRDKTFNPKHEIGTMLCLHSLEELAVFLQDMFLNTTISNDNVWVIGGEQIYKQLLPYCDKAYITMVKETKVADTFFPNLNQEQDWKCNRIQVSEVHNGVTYFQYTKYNKQDK